MSNSYVALRGALSAAVVSAQLLAGPQSVASQRLGVRGALVARSRAAAEPAVLALTTLEPPPVGDQIVLWARPGKPQLPIKVRIAPSRGATSLGEARGATAIQVLPTTVAKGQGGCRQWL